jgi:hypothetical protein
MLKTLKNDTRVKNNILTPHGVKDKRNHTKRYKRQEGHDNKLEKLIFIKNRLHNCEIMNLIIQAHFENFPGWEGWEKLFIKTLIFKHTTRIMINFKIKNETFVFRIRQLFKTNKIMETPGIFRMLIMEIIIMEITKTVGKISIIIKIKL